jgi:hypothetical protein
MLDDEKSNMGILPTIIDSCLLIGYGNKLHNDIILNFYYHHRDSSPKELYTFSSMIRKETSDLWRNPQIEYYMNKNVDSIDLSQVITIDNYAQEGPLEAILDTLVDLSIKDTNKILEVLNQFKIDNNWGFKKKREIITSDSTFINYIMRRVI